MDLNQALAPVRPLTLLVGTLLIIVGVLKFFGLNIPVAGTGLELAAIGWLTKNI